jgi:hypothetical protein
MSIIDMLPCLATFRSLPCLDLDLDLDCDHDHDNDFALLNRAIPCYSLCTCLFSNPVRDRHFRSSCICVPLSSVVCRVRCSCIELLWGSSIPCICYGGQPLLLFAAQQGYEIKIATCWLRGQAAWTRIHTRFSQPRSLHGVRHIVLHATCELERGK